MKSYNKKYLTFEIPAQVDKVFLRHVDNDDDDNVEGNDLQENTDLSLVIQFLMHD